MRPLNHELSLFVVHTLLHTSAYTPQRFMKHHAGTRALNGGDRLCKKDTLVFRHFLCNVTNKHSKHLSQMTKKSQPKHKITTVKSAHLYVSYKQAVTYHDTMTHTTVTMMIAYSDFLEYVISHNISTDDLSIARRLRA